ncbi:MAG: hypothetical protein QM784_07515 [Polyangiaceae bacterium]
MSPLKCFTITCFAISCDRAPTSVPASSAAGVKHTPGKVPTQTQAPPSSPSALRAILADVAATPERYVDRLITVRGRVAVCPGLCDAIKFLCGSVPPTEGNCEGYVALSSERTEQSEVRCIGGAGQGPFESIQLHSDDDRFACRGHCGKWACPAVELGRSYEATGRLRKRPKSEGHGLYVFEPETVDAVE